MHIIDEIQRSYWMLAAISHHPLCKLVLNVLSKYEAQSELMKKIFCGYFPGAQNYKERVTEKSHSRGQAQGSKGTESLAVIH